MSPVLLVGDRTLTSEQILPLMAQYQLVPQLVKELVIDEALKEIECTPAEEKQATEQLFQQYQVNSQEQQSAWLEQSGLSLQQFEAIAIRQFKLEKFKQITWSGDIDSYFRQRKPQLDRVVYSLLRTNDIGIAQEFYFRIIEGEQSFTQLAREFSQGPEADTDGLVGPVELQSIHPTLARVLSSVQPQQLVPPTQVGEWVILMRLEKLLPAQLDSMMRQRLLNERFQTWLQGQLAEHPWQIKG
ncbi:MAG: peptidylprolyl isomerase [Scytonematopsis contorta HA4267-MV1]|nr:peptidylprolyl isomerase [Scytonematopsis contorta HA4267-MV1]